MSRKEKTALLLAVTLIVTVVVVGLTLIGKAKADSAELRLPAGVTLFEDGSVHVDESLQEQRAGQWVCAEMGNGVCGG